MSSQQNTLASIAGCLQQFMRCAVSLIVTVLEVMNKSQQLAYTLGPISRVKHGKEVQTVWNFFFLFHFFGRGTFNFDAGPSLLRFISAGAFVDKSE